MIGCNRLSLDDLPQIGHSVSNLKIKSQFSHTQYSFTFPNFMPLGNFLDVAFWLVFSMFPFTPSETLELDNEYQDYSSRKLGFFDIVRVLE